MLIMSHERITFLNENHRQFIRRCNFTTFFPASAL
ncbi:hypothetical protein BSS2_I2082 [Brucella suis bv. 1 str. S2]|uniref:Uncharacterized protein n=2 Tax=Brucella TaxID=234 RepID=A0A0H3GDV5_BRUSU|nr:hypothetical protein BR2147 [Brucella suis 1330]ACU49105.1 hypothetical protein BMI_I2168 [Brucella microti CCM 4915]AEK55425.1 hypothetical protein BPI_I2204 [Brucella pinnipedialis B2/94]AEU07124.1 hypothetical protein BSVBI22_A2143 [Brucella suis VBI22]AHN47728.1 hypothetical protein BSS2_I2082 [Brucella suis bv. 1 str. S2]EFM57956.1 Hypothetical protein BIBO1_0218 [Brucella inopinata BO1]CDL77518.1 unnamed protein product [Brucella canis str. Oliveri]